MAFPGSFEFAALAAGFLGIGVGNFGMASKAVVGWIVAYAEFSLKSLSDDSFWGVVFFSHSSFSSLFAMDVPSMPSIRYRSGIFPCSTNASGSPNRKSL